MDRSDNMIVHGDYRFYTDIALERLEKAQPIHYATVPKRDRAREEDVSKSLASIDMTTSPSRAQQATHTPSHAGPVIRKLGAVSHPPILSWEMTG